MGDKHLILEHRALMQIKESQLTQEQKRRIRMIESMFGDRPITPYDIKQMSRETLKMYKEQYGGQCDVDATTYVKK